MNAQTSQKIGQFWFKYRSFSPLPLLFLATFFPKYNIVNFRINLLIGLLMLIIGEAGRIWCVGYAGGITRTRTGDLDTLVTSGPFAYVRNPIYLSNIIMYTGVTILLGVPILVPFALLYFFTQYSFIVLYEEGILENSFKDKYLSYKNTVKRWIPSFYIKMLDSGHLFRFSEALHSEKRTFNAFFAIIIIALIKHLIWTI